MSNEIQELEQKLKELKEKRRKERQEQRATAAKEKEEIKKKLDEAKKQKEFEIPDDVIFIKEYGWVKKLPCGPGDYAYSVEATGTYADKKPFKRQLWKFIERSPKYFPFWSRFEDGEVTNVKIVRLKVRSFWIGRVGKLLWLTKEETENFIKENLDWKNEIGYREED